MHRPRKEGPHQRHARELAAAEAAGEPLRRQVTQASRLASLPQLVAQVPPPFQQVEVRALRLASLHPGKRIEGRRQPRHIRQRRAWRQPCVLWHIGHGGTPDNAPGIRLDQACQQLCQHALAGAVAANQADALGLEGVAQVVQQHPPIGQRHGGVAQG